MVNRIVGFLLALTIIGALCRGCDKPKTETTKINNAFKSVK